MDMSAKEIITAAGKAYGIGYKDMIGKTRNANFVRARAAVAFALRARGMSYPQIGRCLHRDHSTVINYFATYSRLLDYPDFAALVDTLQAMPAFEPVIISLPKAVAVEPKPDPLPIWQRKRSPLRQFRAGEIDGEELNEAEFNAMLVRGSQRLNTAIASQFVFGSMAA